MGKFSWKLHLRGGPSCPSSHPGLWPGYRHGASPANEVRSCKYPIWCNSAFFSFTPYHRTHPWIDFPFLLSVSIQFFVIPVEIFSSPLQKWECGWCESFFLEHAGCWGIRVLVRWGCIRHSPAGSSQKIWSWCSCQNSAGIPMALTLHMFLSRMYVPSRQNGVGRRRYI